MIKIINILNPPLLTFHVEKLLIILIYPQLIIQQFSTIFKLKVTYFYYKNNIYKHYMLSNNIDYAYTV